LTNTAVTDQSGVQKNICEIRVPHWFGGHDTLKALGKCVVYTRGSTLQNKNVGCNISKKAPGQL